MVPVNPTSSPSQVAPFLKKLGLSIPSVQLVALFETRVRPTHAAKPHQSSYPWRRNQLEPPGGGETDRHPALGAVLMDSLDHLSLQHVSFNKTHPYLSTKRGGKLQIWRIKAQELGFESYFYRKAMFGWWTSGKVSQFGGARIFSKPFKATGFLVPNFRYAINIPRRNKSTLHRGRININYQALIMNPLTLIIH